MFEAEALLVTEAVLDRVDDSEDLCVSDAVCMEDSAANSSASLSQDEVFSHFLDMHPVSQQAGRQLSGYQRTKSSDGARPRKFAWRAYGGRSVNLSEKLTFGSQMLLGHGIRFSDNIEAT